MTTLRYTPKPRWRESEVITREAGRIRTLLVALQPTSLLIRPKGTRQVLELPYGAAYVRAAWLAADRKRQAKRDARKARAR